MSHKPVGPNGQALNLLNGPALRRTLHGKTPRERAELAAQLIEHKVGFVDLSPAQIARLVAANPGGVSVALGHAGARGPHTSTLNKIVRRYGANTLMRALDHITAPHAVAAE